MMFVFFFGLSVVVLIKLGLYWYYTKQAYNNLN